jgi:1,4-alpha-glucan branching enzyme
MPSTVTSRPVHGVVLDSDWSGYSERFGDGEGGDVTAEPGECDGLPCLAKVSIPPYTALILSQDRN